MRQWLGQTSITTAYIDSGKPWQKAGESFQPLPRRVPGSRVVSHLQEARVLIEQHRRQYNEAGPNGMSQNGPSMSQSRPMAGAPFSPSSLTTFHSRPNLLIHTGGFMVRASFAILAGLVLTAVSACSTEEQSVAGPDLALASSCIRDVSVVGLPASVPANTTGHVGEFRVTNTGGFTSTGSMTCTGWGTITCTGAVPSSATLAPGASVTVDVTFNAGAPQALSGVKLSSCGAFDKRYVPVQ